MLIGLKYLINPIIVNNDVSVYDIIIKFLKKHMYLSVGLLL